MTFAERLKQARKATGISQETLAEKLGVSRQAVTKWETGRGIPDVENIIAISNLFDISVDDLLSWEKEIAFHKSYLYESRTEYDIDGRKRFDFKLGGASLLRLVGTDGEKMAVRLATNDISTLESDFKVKIDDIQGRIDVDVKRRNQMTEAKAKESLLIEVFLPNAYLARVELEANCDALCLIGVRCENMEFKGKANNVSVDAGQGALTLDCNLDMDIVVHDFSGLIELNQVSATSRLTVSEDFAFQCLVKGLSNSVYYEVNGKPTEDLSDPNADNMIEFNGIRSELVIVREVREDE